MNKINYHPPPYSVIVINCVSTTFSTQPLIPIKSLCNFHCTAFSYGCTVGNKTEFLASAELTEEEFQENPIINWDAILWVNRPVELWGVQLVLALISLTEALLLTYLGYKVSTGGGVNQQLPTSNRNYRVISSRHKAATTIRVHFRLFKRVRFPSKALLMDWVSKTNVYF